MVSPRRQSIGGYPGSNVNNTTAITRSSQRRSLAVSIPHPITSTPTQEKNPQISKLANNHKTVNYKSDKNDIKSPLPSPITVGKKINPPSSITPTSRPFKHKRVFTGKRFYFDIKSKNYSTATISQLVDDIQTLGGTVEEFYSKELNIVISDAPLWKLKNPSGAPDGVSPGTPCSLSAITNSPWSPATPIEDKKAPRNRLDTIIDRARQKVKGSCDVIDNAYRWKQTVWSIEKLLEWLKKYKIKVHNSLQKSHHYSHNHKRSQSVDSSFANQKDLQTPYLKFEVHNHYYRPVYQEFKKFPALYVGGQAGVSPFYSRHNIRHNPIKRASQNSHKDIGRKKKQRVVSPEKPQQPIFNDRIKEGGHCEICEANFSDLEKHLNSTSHKQTIGDVLETGAQTNNHIHRGRKHTTNNNHRTAKTKKSLSETRSNLFIGDRKRRQRQRSGNSRRSSLSEAESSSYSSLSENDHDNSDGESFNRKPNMKNKRNGIVSAGNSNGEEIYDFNSGEEHESPRVPYISRRLRSKSESANDSVENGVHQRPKRTSFKAKSYTDNNEEEKKHSDCNGGIHHHQKPMPASKKKRKSSDEKFLEDNSDYYKIQVLPTKLRSDLEHFQQNSSILEEFLRNAKNRDKSEAKSEENKRKQRHKSASEFEEDLDSKPTKKRQQRTLSSQSTNGFHDPADPSQKDSSEPNNSVQNNSDDESDEEIQTRRAPKARKAKSKINGLNSSPSPKRLRKNRSELDKLLEAGSSSFHFETAKEATKRKDDHLGPIHVEVEDPDENKNLRKTAITKPTTEAEEDSDEEEIVNEERRPLRQRKKIIDFTFKRKKSPNKNVKLKKRLQRPLLTKADLMEGPAFIPSKEELLKPKKKNIFSKASLARKKEYIPQNLISGLTKRLKSVNSHSVDVYDMKYSFENPPFREGWFQAYSRQDQGDEILFYPATTKWFPLPYEMPNTTFYPSKPGAKKRKLITESSRTSSVNPSGTATPEEILPRKVTRSLIPSTAPATPLNRSSKRAKNETLSKRKNSKSSTTDSDSNGTISKGLLARLGQKASLSLSDYSRKSPRCHASTKALLTNSSTQSPAEDEDDDEQEQEIEVNNTVFYDECSNDSFVQNKKKNFVTEDPVELSVIADSLEKFFVETDPLLYSSVKGLDDLHGETQAETECLESSSNLSGHHRKKKKRKSHSKPKYVNSPDDTMDRFVAATVDSMLLDCLEDELPSVTFDDELPESIPMNLISNYKNCDSMSKCGAGRWFKKANNRSQALFNETPQCSSVPTPIPKVPTVKPLTKKKIVDDSSSECTSACETVSLSGSVSSVGPIRRKRKRNMTGFPTIKRKKKSLLNNVLTRKAVTPSSVNNQTVITEDSDVDVSTKTTPKKQLLKRKSFSPKRRLNSMSPKKKNVRQPARKAAKTKPKQYKEPDSDLDNDGDESDSASLSELESDDDVPVKRLNKPKGKIITKSSVKKIIKKSPAIKKKKIIVSKKKNKSKRARN